MLVNFYGRDIAVFHPDFLLLYASNITMKSLYLILYNALGAALWARILLSALTTAPSSLYSSIEPWVRGTQTLAIAEIFHASLGILLRSSPKDI